MPEGGPRLVESHALDLLPAFLGRKQVERGPLAMFLRGPPGLAAVAEDIEYLRARRVAVRTIAGRHASRLPLWRAAGEHLVVRRYFHEAYHRLGAQRLVEKTPNNIVWIRHLAMAFPTAAFLFITRHPIDSLTSHWRRYRDDPAHPEWANITVDEFCDAWRNSTTTALEFAREDPRLLVIRYEDFTSATEETVRRVLDHCGEEFHEACLLKEPDGREWDGDPLLVSSVKVETKRWQDYIDPQTAEEVERRLAPTMTLAGYAPRQLR